MAEKHIGIYKSQDPSGFLTLYVVAPYNLSSESSEGKIVFDKDGRKIGLVSSIDLYGERNKLKSIHIKTGVVPFLMKKEFVIEANKIKNVGENIILKVSKDSLSEIRDSGEVK